ncbi:uncharacterized protein [Littorina saxatilis]|uniref:uncharacterized protein n=1 Tax=Littorina saxatilis TaxID=31220 RepID=UPI0038B622F9
MDGLTQRDLCRYTVSGFDLGHLIVIFILLGCAIFVIYWLWVYPCGMGDTQEEGVTSRQNGRCGRVISRPETTSSSPGHGKGEDVILYALELEPGTIILQSPNGDLFRILQECDSVANRGSPTSGLPPGASVPVHYIPAYTRAHVQTYPSAPPYPGWDAAQEVTSSREPWQPLCIQSGSNF